MHVKSQMLQGVCHATHKQISVVHDILLLWCCVKNQNRDCILTQVHITVRNNEIYKNDLPQRSIEKELEFELHEIYI